VGPVGPTARLIVTVLVGVCALELIAVDVK
jgi:hypothetical protein